MAKPNKWANILGSIIPYSLKSSTNRGFEHCSYISEYEIPMFCHG